MPELLKMPKASIVLVQSPAAYQPVPGATAYVVSRFALRWTEGAGCPLDLCHRCRHSLGVGLRVRLRNRIRRLHLDQVPRGACRTCRWADAEGGRPECNCDKHRVGTVACNEINLPAQQGGLK